MFDSKGFVVDLKECGRAEIGEAAMITHAPESKVIAASRLFRASLVAAGL
jgi:hypothetical protein